MYRWWRTSGVVVGLRSKVSTLFESNCQWRRHFSRERAENVRKINPRLSTTDASSMARNLYEILKPHSPFSISTAWLRAQESGIDGLSSKTHLKLMLKWMRGRKMLKLRCDQVGSTKKFLLSTLPEDPNVVRPPNTNDAMPKPKPKPKPNSQIKGKNKKKTKA